MIQIVDLFCGAGGTSTGALSACRSLGLRPKLTAINHWPRAVETHAKNHPDAEHLCMAVEQVNPLEVCPDRKLDLLVASPECTHHSIARGGRPIKEQKRTPAWSILRWADMLDVKNIIIENVPEFMNWGPVENGKAVKARKGETFQAFIGALQSLGYAVEHRILNAADFGDPTSRKRLFIIARKNGKPSWPAPTHTKESWRPASEIIDWDLSGKSIFNRKRPLADATMRRIMTGLKKFGGPAAEPFLIKYHGSHKGKTDGDKRVHALSSPIPTLDTSNRFGLVQPFLTVLKGKSTVRSLNQPLSTVTTKSHLALVQPDGVNLDILFRMLQPHELAAGMSFPKNYQFTGTKADQVAQIGNAVPVEMATALCLAVLAGR